jgi:hypothetical protein
MRAAFSWPFCGDLNHVDVIQVTAGAARIDYHKLIANGLAQVLSDCVGEISRYQVPSNIVQVDGVVHIDSEWVLARSFPKENHRHLRVNRACRFENVRVLFARIPAHAAVAHVEATIEGDARFIADGSKRLSPCEILVSIRHTLSNLFRQPFEESGRGGFACSLIIE